MQRIFLALVISYVLVMGAAFTAGLMIDSERSFAVHFGLGLFATIFTCLIYCVVLTYLVITGKLIKGAVLTAHLDEQLIRDSQDPKGKVVRLTVVAGGLALAAAMMGAWADLGGASHAGRGTMHMIAEVVAVTCNLGAFALTYQYIKNNAGLVNEAFQTLQRKKVPSPLTR